MNEISRKQIRMHQWVGFIKDFFLALFIFLFYFIPVLVSTAVHSPEYLWVAFLPLPIFIGAVIYFIIRGKKFKDSVIAQVEALKCNLDPEIKKVAWGVFVSRNWLIVSGRFAVCRYNFRHGAHKEKHSKNGPSYVIKIVTDDNKTYRFNLSDAAKVRMIKKWIRNAR